MKEYTKKLIRLHFKDNPIFEKLSDERKELLYEKYILVYSILPIDAKLFYKRRVSVNNAILHLISNNMACCLSGTYIYSLYTQFLDCLSKMDILWFWITSINPTSTTNLNVNCINTQLF